jgi:NAD(P)-dependent dehydrogenase (short-subunit alcohol dehydrogenase family)
MWPSNRSSARCAKNASAWTTKSKKKAGDNAYNTRIILADRQDRIGHRRLARPGPADGAGVGRAGRQGRLSARKQADLDEAIAFLTQRGISAHAVAADLSQDVQAEALVTAALAHLGHIDILINNAGASWGAPAEDYPIEAWDKVMNLNIRSIFLVSQAGRQASMIPRKSAASSTSPRSPAWPAIPPGTMQTIAYNTSKGAVVNFTRTWRASGAVTASPSTRWRRASSHRR